MNIEQYRALKAQSAVASQTDQPSTVAPKVETQTTPEEVPTTTQPIVPLITQPTTITTPEKIMIDGVEVSINELKNGYLRQTDYTQKTQEVARQRKEVESAVTLFEQLKQNPQVAQQLLTQIPSAQSLDPATAKVVELENKVYDMMLEREIDNLTRKYSDFEIKSVLEVAQAKNITNLEDAYLLHKSKTSNTSPTNIEELKKQLRQELLNEIEAEKNATQTIITSGNGGIVVQDNSPKLSEGERKVARMMKLSESDYTKWRDVGRK